MEYFLGMAASLGDVILSGFVSIYFEKVLKSKAETYSVWDRNFQMAFWSAAVCRSCTTSTRAAAGVVVGHRRLRGVRCPRRRARRAGHQAHRLDHETIATTGSIVLTTILNAAFLGGPFNLPILTGGLVVIVSVFNYNDKGDPQQES